MTLTGTPKRVAIVGGAGKVSRELIPLLLKVGIEPVPLARRDEQLEELEAMGAAPRRLDIEAASADDFMAAFEGCDGVVFSAGGGADGNVERKRTVDFEGSIKSAQAAAAMGIDRFVQVSAIGVDNPADPASSASWRAYVDAKREADDALRQTQLAWTILRPGSLTSDAPTGRITLAPAVPHGAISRADLAATIVDCLQTEDAVGQQWELVCGETPIKDAIADYAS